MWYVAHGYFAYVNETSFAYPEHLVHEGVAVLAHVEGNVIYIMLEGVPRYSGTRDSYVRFAGYESDLKQKVQLQKSPYCSFVVVGHPRVPVC